MSSLQGLPEVFVMPDGHRYIIAGDRLFSPETHEYYRHGRFTKKQKRNYMRLKSGMTLAIAGKERLCFLTLTTKYDKNKPEKRLERIKEQNYAFTKLKQKIERYLQKTMYVRYCKKHKLSPFELHGAKKSIKYPQLHARFKFKLKYFKLKTAEGGGVMHIVFRKPYNVPKIPFEWLQKQWTKIWGSPRVNISEIKVRDSQKLSMYLVGQYFAKQPVIRMSYGQQWVYPGFVKSFKHLIEVYGFKRAIEIWNKRMKNNDLPITGRQTRLRHRKFPAKTQGVIGLKHWNCTEGGFRYLPKSFQSFLDDPVYSPVLDSSPFCQQHPWKSIRAS